MSQKNIFSPFKKFELSCLHVLSFISLVVLILFISTTNVYSAQVTLAWNPNTEPDLGGYKIHSGPSSGNYNNVINVGNQTSYTFPNLAEGQTYYIAATAYNTSNNESGYSAEVVYTVPILDLTAPSTPTSLQATTISTSQINLSWNASSDNIGVTGYRIYRDSTQIATTSNTTYQDTGLSSSTTYSYTVSAYDAAGNESGQSSASSAATNINQPPVLNTIANITVNEGATVAISPAATDPDGDALTYTYSGWMTSSSYTTNYTDAGSHSVTVTVSDGTLTDSQIVTVIVLNSNNAPVLDPITDITVYEGDTVTFSPTATDADGDALTYTYSGWMTSSSYTTTSNDAGIHTVTVTVSDGTLTDTRDVTVTVNNVQTTTIFSNLDSYLGNASNWKPLTPSRWDVISDGGDLRYRLNTTNYLPLPGYLLGEYSLIANRNYGDFVFTGKVRVTTDLVTNNPDIDIVFGFQDPNNYYFMMINSNPNWSDIHKVVNGTRITFAHSTGLSINDNNYHDVKIERVGSSIKVYYDGMLQINATDSTFLTGQVGIGSSGGAVPLWDDIIIGGTLPIDTDGDGVPDSMDAFPNDPNESVDTDSDGIGNNADTDDDNDGMLDTWEIANGLDPLDDGSVDINNGPDGDIDGDGFTNQQEYTTDTIGNQAPVLNSIANITTNEGATITLSPTATDPNGDALSFSYTGWMTSSNYTTNYNDSGIHMVTITVSDGSLIDSQDVMVTIIDVDSILPSTPANLQATAISTSQINLSWNTSSDNIGVTGYRIYRDGIQVADVSNTAYQDSGLSSSTTYSYTVSAYDAAGNESSQSTPTPVSTAANLPPGNPTGFTIIGT